MPGYEKFIIMLIFMGSFKTGLPGSKRIIKWILRIWELYLVQVFYGKGKVWTWSICPYRIKWWKCWSSLPMYSSYISKHGVCIYKFICSGHIWRWCCGRHETLRSHQKPYFERYKVIPIVFYKIRWKFHLILCFYCRQAKVKQVTAVESSRGQWARHSSTFGFQRKCLFIAAYQNRYTGSFESDMPLHLSYMPLN